MTYDYDPRDIRQKPPFRRMLDDLVDVAILVGAFLLLVFIGAM